jgi:hypothetical protein
MAGPSYLKNLAATQPGTPLYQEGPGPIWTQPIGQAPAGPPVIVGQLPGGNFSTTPGTSTATATSTAAQPITPGSPPLTLPGGQAPTGQFTSPSAEAPVVNPGGPMIPSRFPGPLPNVPTQILPSSMGDLAGLYAEHGRIY